jgi:hypothetical protein
VVRGNLTQLSSECLHFRNDVTKSFVLRCEAASFHSWFPKFLEDTVVLPSSIEMSNSLCRPEMSGITQTRGASSLRKEASVLDQTI